MRELRHSTHWLWTISGMESFCLGSFWCTRLFVACSLPLNFPVRLQFGEEKTGRLSWIIFFCFGFYHVCNVLWGLHMCRKIGLGLGMSVCLHPWIVNSCLLCIWEFNKKITEACVRVDFTSADSYHCVVGWFVLMQISDFILSSVQRIYLFMWLLYFSGENTLFSVVTVWGVAVSNE